MLMSARTKAFWVGGTVLLAVGCSGEAGTFHLCGDTSCATEPRLREGESCGDNGQCASRTCGQHTRVCEPARPDDGLENGTETDVDCGGESAPACGEGKRCDADRDCRGACNYAHRCIDVPSCKPHLGGDTCGKGEVDESGAQHESCCRSLPVAGFTDPAHPGKAVFLDKYEITAGRVRAFLAAVAAGRGAPDVRGWVAQNTPPTWNNAWGAFLPSSADAGTVRVDRRLLGDRRGEAGEPPVPDADQDQPTSVNFQFNGSLFVYLHGNNCSTHEGSYGFPTFFYPPDVLARTGPATFPPRADGFTLTGAMLPASESLDVKSMNCITNAMLVAFCHWDGGQLATDEVLDFVTGSPKTLGNAPGCGTQIGTEQPPTSSAATRGGRCPDLSLINATFDAGGRLPREGHPANTNNYAYPVFPTAPAHDKAWEIAAPGRGSLAAAGAQVDMVRIRPGDEPWMDLAGNLNESVLVTSAGVFTGKFGLKYRGIGYQSARSVLNVSTTWSGEGGIARIQRPEARAGFAGGRCMRFR